MTLNMIWNTTRLLKRDRDGAVVLRFPVLVQSPEENADPLFQEVQQAGLIELSARIGLESLFLETPLMGQVFVTTQTPHTRDLNENTDGVQAMFGLRSWVTEVLQEYSSPEQVSAFLEQTEALTFEEGILWMSNDGLLIVTGRSPSGLLSAVRALTSDNFGKGLPEEAKLTVRHTGQHSANHGCQDGLTSKNNAQRSDSNSRTLHTVFSGLRGMASQADDMFPEADIQVEVTSSLPAIEHVLQLVATIGLESSYIRFPITRVGPELLRETALQISFSIQAKNSGGSVHLNNSYLDFQAESSEVLSEMLQTVIHNWFLPPSDVECSDWRGKLAALFSSAPDIRMRAQTELLLTDLLKQAPVSHIETPSHLRKSVEAWCNSHGASFEILSDPELLSLDWQGKGEWDLIEPGLSDYLRKLMNVDKTGPSNSYTTERLDATNTEDLSNHSHSSSLLVEIFTTIPRITFDKNVSALQNDLRSREFSPFSVEFIYRNVTKPGLSWFLSDILPFLQDNPEVALVEIAARKVPEHTGFLDLPQRFLQEFFPIDAIIERQTKLSRDAVTLHLLDELESMYRVTVRDADNKIVGKWTWDSLVETRPYMPGQSTNSVLVPAAGYRITEVNLSIHSPRTLTTETIQTVYSQFWNWYQNEVISRLVAAMRPNNGPTAFSQLQLEFWTDSTEESHGIYEEVVSWPEALHEDIYFYTLHVLRNHSEAVNESIWRTPGLIVPRIHAADGPPRAKIQVSAYASDEIRVRTSEMTKSINLSNVNDDFTSVNIHTVKYQDGVWTVVSDNTALAAGHGVARRLISWLNTTSASSSRDASVQVEESPLDPPGARILPEERQSMILQNNDVIRWLNEHSQSLSGKSWVIDHSFQGRPILGVELYALVNSGLTSRNKHTLFKPTLLVLARHHANEISSTNSALNFIATIMENPEILRKMNIVIVPLHNTDGAALHRSLIEEHPHWKHHAARFNACGYEFGNDYFKVDTQFGESRVAKRLYDAWKPDIVLDDHGIPSHEWIQPFSGYSSPPSFPVSYWIPHAQIYTIWRELDPSEPPIAGGLIETVSRTLSSDAKIQGRNAEFLQRYQKWGQAFSPDKFPLTTVDNVITYRWKVSTAVDSKDFIGHFPALVTADIVTEVSDETVHGEALSEVVYAHSKAHEGILSWLMSVKTDVIRTQDSSLGFARVGLQRKRPLL